MSLPRIKDLVLATKTQRLQFLDSISALIDSTDASMSKPTGHEASYNQTIATYVIENIDNLILLGVVGYTAVDAAAFHKALSSVNGPQELAQQMLDKMATERTIADNVVFDAAHAELYRDYTEQIDVNGGLSPEASNLWLSFEQQASTILPFVTTALNAVNSRATKEQLRNTISTQVRNIADVSGYRNLAVIQEIINVLMIDGIEEKTSNTTLDDFTLSLIDAIDTREFPLEALYTLVQDDKRLAFGIDITLGDIRGLLKNGFELFSVNTPELAERNAINNVYKLIEKDNYGKYLIELGGINLYHLLWIIAGLDNSFDLDNEDGPKDYATLHQEIVDYLNSQPSISKVSELFENPNKYGDIVSHFSFKYNVVPGSGIVPGMTFNIEWKPTTVSTIFIPDYGYNPIYPENDIIEQVKVYLSDANTELSFNNIVEPKQLVDVYGDLVKQMVTDGILEYDEFSLKPYNIKSIIASEINKALIDIDAAIGHNSDDDYIADRIITNFAKLCVNYGISFNFAEVVLYNIYKNS